MVVVVSKGADSLCYTVRLPEVLTVTGNMKGRLTVQRNACCALLFFLLLHISYV